MKELIIEVIAIQIAIAVWGSLILLAILGYL